MKPLIKWTLGWMLGVLLVFALLSAACHLHLQKHPRKVLVALDSSFAMQPLWPQMPQILKDIGRRRYAEFCLVTEKRRVHGWAPVLKWGRMQPYAPRDFSKLAGSGQYPEIGQAACKYLITNAGAKELEGFGGWTIIQPAP